MTTPDLLKDLEAVALLPCPFCGSQGATVGGMIPWVECDKCEASGPHCATDDEAIAAWNTRAHHSAIEAAVRGKLEAEQEFLRDWLQFISHPVGMDCCGRGHGGDCCGDGVPAYPSVTDAVQAMNNRLNEVDAAIDAQHNSSREGSDGH